MTDGGLKHLLRSLLDCKTKGQAQGILDQTGKDYLSTAKELVGRLSFARTTNQNSILHKWYGEIADHLGDRTASDVKGDCHLAFALSIRLRDEQFAWLWERTGALINDPDRQRKLLASGQFAISSKMTTKELKEYMTEIEQEYRPRGVQLTDPKERKV